MNIAAILHERALAHGRRAAIVERGRTVTFAELDAAATGASATLSRMGLEPGARVLVLSPMSIDLYVTMIALFRRRMTAVFVDPAAGTKHVTAAVARVRPQAFIGVPRAHLLRVVSPAIRAIPIKTTPRAIADGGSAFEDIIACDPETPAIITFTSGATGLPKPAVRSQGFLLAQHRALASSLGLVDGDADLTTLPIVLLANLASGVTSIIADGNLLAPGAVDPDPIVAQIDRLRPTGIVATPALLERVVVCARRRRARLDSVRRVHTGGAPVFPDLLDRVAAVAPHATVVGVYGSTEAEPIAAIARPDLSALDRCAMQRGAGLLVGRPEASIDVRILPDRWGTPVTVGSDTDVDRMALQPMGAGEIVVAGDHVLRGYLDGAGDEEMKICAGARVWHRTGDAGYFDCEGRLWLLGRCAAKVGTGEDAVYPLSVEAAASDVPGVRRSAFASHRGRRVLVAEIDGEAAAVRSELLRRLSWARLDEVVTAGSVPVDRRHNAKVDYQALDRLLAARLG